MERVNRQWLVVLDLVHVEHPADNVNAVNIMAQNLTDQGTSQAADMPQGVRERVC